MAYSCRYVSKNGYSGRLYGRSTLVIYDPDGKECFHTYSRKINTYKELVETVDTFPDFLKILWEE